MGHVHEVEMFIFNLQFDFSVLPMGRSSNGEDSLTEESLKTMSRYRKITTICCAAVFALGLAACGGGGDDGLNTSQEQELQNQVATLQGQINDLRKQLGLEPADDLGDSVSGLQQEVADLQKQIQDAADAEERAEAEAKAEEMAAAGKALHKALGAMPLANLEDTDGAVLSTTGLAINAAAGAGALAADTNPEAVTLKAGASVMPLGSWNGMDYAAAPMGTGDNKYVADMARVYTNQGAPKTVDFADEHPNLTTLVHTLIMADAFVHQGTQTHPMPENNGNLIVPGTYDGAPGKYTCAAPGPCSSTNDGKGSPSTLGGTWTFTPDKGAMVSTPDAHYLYYGWWVHKNDKGTPMAASAFAGRAGTDDSTDGLDDAVALNSITGSATYVGNAAGKFAIDNVLAGTGSGGHFTADAMLMAEFGSEDGKGVTGTIDNFMLNDTESVDWSVALMKGGLGNDNAIMAATTVWSIDGNKAPASGTWSGTMYDEMPGNTDDTPPGDGSNIPTTVTGTFSSDFGSIGRMVGAFGANKQ